MRAGDGRFTILVADDSAVYRKLVERTLELDCYSLVFAKSGRSALELFEKHRPSLVITDWMMPDFTGIELCQRIRASAQDSYCYIIIVTGISEKENVVKGLAAGADDYLTKPFYPEELSARVAVGRRIVELQSQNEAKNRLLEELALTDSLTTLPNRRAIEEWASRQLLGASRHGFSIYLALADLDNFKRVNDTYGHEAGDTVLKEVGEILKANLRRSDIGGRIGGEEFLLVLTHTKRESVELFIGRVLQQLRDHEFPFDGQKIQVTASFGIAGFQGKHAPDFAKLLKQADAALYAAKRAGRNRIEFAASPDE
jgi:diguanylate cyclase (GGDEF)-like protein